MQGVEQERRAQALDILWAALAAVDPAKAVARWMVREGDTLQVGQRRYDLAAYQRILVIGGGKAGSSMAMAVEEMIGDRLTAGLVNVKYGYKGDRAARLSSPKSLAKIEINEAGHPIPDAQGQRGAQRMMEMVRGLTPQDLVICLISGGGSALLTLPVEGIKLQEVKELTTALLRCGATINEINAVRKHISRIKGGCLARLAYPADVVSLILSDVVGSPLDIIASGPTVPDTSTFAEACGVLERYDLWDEIPASIAEHLTKGKEGEIPETPKEGDQAFEKVYNLIIGSNEMAARAALERAKELGFNSQLLSTYVEGEAREVGKVFAALAKEIAHSGNPLPRPAFLVAGGETTVTIRGGGLGGRNQELALAAALGIAGLEGVMIVGAATDGTDGPTDAAGALATGTTVAQAQEMGLDAQAYLAHNDSYHFFEKLGDLLITGPTNTNVNDLIFLFAF